MPQLPVTVNANITRIDAPFPEAWREQLFQFSNGLKEIKDLMTVMAISLTESKEAEEMMVKLYSSESLAERASQAHLMEQREQGRPVNAQGEETGASRPVNASPMIYEAPIGTPGYERQKQEEQDEYSSHPPDAPPAKKESEKSKYERSTDYLEANPVTQVAHYGGNFTTADLLNIFAQGANKLSNGDPKSFFGKTTANLGWAAQTAIPNIQASMAFARKGQAASESLGSYAGSLGFEAGNGPLGLNSASGPLGSNFRIPLLNSAALSGLSSTAEAYGTALSYPGLSGTQVMAMNTNLAERGWFPGQKGQQELFDAQAHLISKGGVMQQLGEDPGTAEMLDESTRNGNASMEEMIQTIEEIPDAAEKAHEGIAQFQASMREVGEFNESIGGTKYEGQQQAKLLSESTGMPIQAVKGMIESPYTQSAIFRETGVPSWGQGSVPAAIKNGIAIKEFWRRAQQVGPGEVHTFKLPDGQTITRSAKEAQATQMHLLEPNESYESILKRLREGRTGMEGREGISAELESWKRHFNEISGHGKEGVENELLRATRETSHGEDVNFGGILHNMAQLKTAQGKPMFNHKDLKKIRTNDGQGYSGHGKQLAAEKYKEVHNILNEKSGKDANAAGNSGTYVLELSQAAKQLLQLPNKKTRMKLEAGAGENQTNNAYSGYSDPPSPRPYGQGPNFDYGGG